MPPVINDLVSQIVARLDASPLPPASIDTSHESSAVYWAVVSQRTDQQLKINTSRDPSPFQAMAHAKPSFTVDVSGLAPGAECELMRLVASTVRLPPQSRAIPFSVMTSDPAPVSLVIGAAFTPPNRVVATLVGHARAGGAPLRALVFGEDDVVIVGLDGYSPRFGVVVARAPLGDVERVDLDEESGFGVRIKTTEYDFLSTTMLAGDVDRVRQLVGARQIATRRLVPTGPNVRSWA